MTRRLLQAKKETAAVSLTAEPPAGGEFLSRLLFPFECVCGLKSQTSPQSVIPEGS